MRDFAVALWGEWRPEPEDTFSIEGHRLVVVGGQDAGWITALRFPDHIWVDKLYVAPAIQNRRHGKMALGIVLAKAADVRPISRP